MAIQATQRPLSTIVSEFDGTLSGGFLLDQSNFFYLPISYTGFTAPDLSLTGISGSSGGSTLSAAVAGAFDNVRPGDILSALGSVTLTPPTTGSVTGTQTFKGLPFIIYPDTITFSALPVQAGDTIVSAASEFATGTKVVRIDSKYRRIFLSANATVTGTSTFTFTKPVRVTTVRLSTALTNPNQIDIDGTLGSAAVSVAATIKVGAIEAVNHVIRVQPVNNTTGSRANFNIGVAYLDGTRAMGSKDGLNGIDVTSLAYLSVGSYGYDSDLFLTNARVPRG